MGIPLRQKWAVAKYLLLQKLKGNKRYPLVLMLEPLFRCNLKCAGCGKIAYPKEILQRQLSVEECLQAAEECGAPIVSIPGGEPLLHKEMPRIVSALIKRKKFVYLCTNALLLKKRLKDYTPSPYLTFSVHLDGLGEKHDEAVCQEGVFERAVEAIKEALRRGFRVTINCTVYKGQTAEEIAQFLDYCMALGVEAVTISPAFQYEKAPRQDVFIRNRETKELFRKLFNIAKEQKRRWRFNHSSLYLDFLAGNRAYHCTPWGNPTRNIFGWQKPCYFLADEGYAKSFQELMETTPWEKYGSWRNPKCAHCMAHCGYEPTAVAEAISRPWEALRVALFGPRTEGPMVPDPEPPKTPEEKPIELKPRAAALKS